VDREWTRRERSRYLSSVWRQDSETSDLAPPTWKTVLHVESSKIVGSLVGRGVVGVGDR